VSSGFTQRAELLFRFRILVFGLSFGIEPPRLAKSFFRLKRDNVTSHLPLMNEQSSSPRTEYGYAFLILRLWLGLRALFAGLEKFESKGSYSFSAYYENMGRMATGISGASFLPLWSTKLFAFSIGYLLLVFGLTLLLGIKTRLTLLAHGLLYVALSFGLMVVQEAEGVAWLGMHVVLTVGALLLVRYNRFAVTRD
jgi:thiosulfate dehydrogenase [quinone] large subunit